MSELNLPAILAEVEAFEAVQALPASWRQQQPTPTSCFRACVAMILRMPVDEVTRACDGDSWDWDAFQDWLKPMGLQAVEVIMDRDGPVLYPIPHGVPVIITGKSPRPCPSGRHAVVARSIGLDGFELVHDPHKAQEWIEGDAKFATFFAAIDPRVCNSTIPAHCRALVAEVERLQNELQSLRAERDQWEATARRQASKAGMENSDYLQPDEVSDE